jgi:hypothetical protein
MARSVVPGKIQQRARPPAPPWALDSIGRGGEVSRLNVTPIRANKGAPRGDRGLHTAIPVDETPVGAIGRSRPRGADLEPAAGGVTFAAEVDRQ